MSLFRIIKYSALLHLASKYRVKLFRIVAVLLFAWASSILYQDVAAYMEDTYPDTVIYALIGKIIIVYGALIFVLLQFRPESESTSESPSLEQGGSEEERKDRLSALSNLDTHNQLRTRAGSVHGGGRENHS
jgi:hypothetical protein